MSLARQNARKFLSLEQVCLVEEIFEDRQLRTHIFELLFDYSENAGTPEYQNWRLLLDEIGKSLTLCGPLESTKTENQHKTDFDKKEFFARQKLK